MLTISGSGVSTGNGWQSMLYGEPCCQDTKIGVFKVSTSKLDEVVSGSFCEVISPFVSPVKGHVFLKSMLVSTRLRSRRKSSLVVGERRVVLAGCILKE